MSITSDFTIFWPSELHFDPKFNGAMREPLHVYCEHFVMIA